MKDLGNLQYFLGIEVARNITEISVSQRKYVLDLLKDTGMMGCKPLDTPIDPSIKLKAKAEDKLVDEGQFHRLVVKPIYLAYTRTDISFVVSCVSQFMRDPTECHIEAIKRILRYLKGSPGRGLLFKTLENGGIKVFVDTDWTGCPNDRRSTSRYCT